MNYETDYEMDGFETAPMFGEAEEESNWGFEAPGAVPHPEFGMVTPLTGEYGNFEQYEADETYEAPDGGMVPHPRGAQRCALCSGCPNCCSCGAAQSEDELRRRRGGRVIRRRRRGGYPVYAACPDGTVRDASGRCVCVAPSYVEGPPPPAAGFTPTPVENPGGGQVQSEYDEFAGESGFLFEHPLPRPASPPAPPLSAAQVAAAVRANQLTARQLGWGHVIGGRVRPSRGVLGILSLSPGVAEDALARAVQQFQRTEMRQRGNGIIDRATFTAMVRKGAFPNLRQRKSWTVRIGGATLGVIEQTAPYVPTSSNQGVEIQFGFRVTNMDAVRRARFVDTAGENDFRWIQLIELRRIGATSVEPRIQQLRRHGRGRIIDPTDALLPVDAHPYYRYETTITDPRFGGSSGPGSGWHVSDEHNAEGRNGLCYDWLFYDRPNIPTNAAQPGRRAYFNFETALVGRRRQRNGETCNVLLNTVLWGFDIIQQRASFQLKLNALQAGRFGGSPDLRQWLNRELNRGGFARHHFLGKDFTGRARCT
jgi:hypothetical protein